MCAWAQCLFGDFNVYGSLDLSNNIRLSHIITPTDIIAQINDKLQYLLNYVSETVLEI
jgi:hypothetical protein